MATEQTTTAATGERTPQRPCISANQMHRWLQYAGRHEENIEMPIKNYEFATGNGLMAYLAAHLKPGVDISLGPMGRIRLREVRERSYRNPQKPQEWVAVPAHFEIDFSPSAAFKRLMNPAYDQDKAKLAKSAQRRANREAQREAQQEAKTGTTAKPAQGTTARADTVVAKKETGAPTEWSPEFTPPPPGLLGRSRPRGATSPQSRSAHGSASSQ